MIRYDIDCQSILTEMLPVVINGKGRRRITHVTVAFSYQHISSIFYFSFSLPFDVLDRFFGETPAQTKRPRTRSPILAAKKLPTAPATAPLPGPRLPRQRLRCCHTAARLPRRHCVDGRAHPENEVHLGDARAARPRIPVYI